MKIGFESKILKGPLSGVGTYALNLLSALKSLQPDIGLCGYSNCRWTSIGEAELETTIFRNRDYSFGDAGTSEQILDNVRVRARSNDLVRRIWRTAQEAGFRFSIGRQEIDIYHAFAALPPAIVPVGKRDFRQVLLIHDVSHLHLPQFHPTERLRWLDRLPTAIKQAARINTVSEFSRREIARAYGISPDSIVVTHPGVSPVFRHVPEAASRSVLDHFRLVAGNYYLVVGSLEPRKNINTVVQAYGRLPERVREVFPLVIAGPLGPLQEQLKPPADELRYKGQLRVLGYCGQSELASLYSHTTLFLFPSFYEGFGIPLAEAMACGCPVVYSEIGALCEVAGDLGVRIAPTDIDAWTSVMDSAVKCGSSGGKKLQSNIDRAMHFQWSKTAAETLNMYHDVLSE